MKAILLIVFSLSLATSIWHTNLDDAQKEASKNNTNILLVFSGSDWCKPCIQLKNTVFKSSEFEAVVKGKYELVVIDFKRDNSGVSKEEITYRENIAEKYNPNGYFPLVVILDAKGNIVKSIESYKGETAKYYVDKYLN